MTKSNNPIVSDVQERFNDIKRLTYMLGANPDAAIRGLLISGNAGMGKTEFVSQGLQDFAERVQFIKGSSITAAALYVILYLNREPGNVLVLDDTDIIHLGSKEMSTILDMFKGATELTKGPRMLGWQRASQNQLIKDNNVPMEFDFQGSIVWITNDTVEDIAKKAKGHWNAISSRFVQSKVWFNDQEKLMYTLHLIEECGLLGQECRSFEGGYSPEIISETCNYIRSNYRSMNDITPRVALMIADLQLNYPEDWQSICDNQFLS